MSYRLNIFLLALKLYHSYFPVFMLYCNMTTLPDKDLNKYVGLPREVWWKSKDCIFLAALHQGTGVYKELEANLHYIS